MPSIFLRSVRLGMIILATGFGIPVAGFLVSFKIVGSWHPTSDVSGAVLLGSLAVGAMLLALGGRMIRWRPDQIWGKNRPPVVYLRPFKAEAQESVGGPRWQQVRDRWILLIVLVAVLLSPFCIVLVSRVPFLRERDPLCFLFAVWLCLLALMAWRAIVGWTVTFERELTHALGVCGPVVAVGRPGEWFAPLGAARVYFTDDAWRDGVRDLLARAAVVVLQAVPSGATWWELEECVRLVPSERWLFLMTSVNRDPWRQGFLAERVYEATGVVLPEIDQETLFVMFDRDGSATSLQPQYRFSFGAVLRESTLDLPATLAPFLRRLATLPPPASRDA